MHSRTGRLVIGAGLIAIRIFLPQRAAAQIPLLVTGSVGASYDIDDRSPLTGGGFAYLTGIGLQLRRVTFGVEFGQNSLGGERRARQYGAFVRLPATNTGPVRLFFIAGLADYRYSPASVSRKHALGGSVGPGATIALGSERARAVIQARFHAGFDRLATVSSQEFLSVMAGVEFGL